MHQALVQQTCRRIVVNSQQILKLNKCLLVCFCSKNAFVLYALKNMYAAEKMFIKLDKVNVLINLIVLTIGGVRWYMNM